MAFSSYNDHKENILKNTLIIAIINSATSIFAAIAMFSILGYRLVWFIVHFSKLKLPDHYGLSDWSCPVVS